MKRSSEWKLLIVSLNKDRYLFRRIKEESSKLNISTKIIHYSDIEIEFDKKTDVYINGSPMPKFHVVILDAPYSYTILRNFLVKLFSKPGVFLLNGKSLKLWPTLSKLTQTYELLNGSIPIIPSHIVGTTSKLLAAIKSIDSPKIAKSIDGSSGRNVWEITSDIDLQESPLRHHVPYHLLIQPKINAQNEFRVIILGNKVLGAVKKTPLPGEFRANWSQGATLSTTNLPDVVKAIAIRSCEILQCDFAGVDILYSKNGLTESCWVLEVNRLFGFEGFENATNINVASALLNWISNQMNIGQTY